ncbi:hypothetical protein PMZ80_011102 [Knufia obscura]|uniref:Heterokaryon incompatibility domain-containing protein n=1 Tax=Knufia obscura TaxID=1635080 RepID=A0ABR0R8Q5_9EURO|nr:hypothetical protein PMZ80_011102 [Knufia obscura]
MAQLPPYEAISYCWTTSQGQKTIECNSAPLVITESLYNALIARADLGNVGYLWADTICISQTDVQEKNAQVREIGRIFSSASHVWIFAGGLNDVLSGPTGRLLRFHADKMDHPLARRLQQLAFFDLPYFERLWVVQEICNARSVSFIYEGQSVPWEAVSTIAAELRRRFDRSGIIGCRTAQHVDNVCQIEELHHRLHTNNDLNIGSESDLEAFGEGQTDNRARLDIVDLVSNTSRFKTGDPRDRIFALVGLAGDLQEGDWELLPDYAASTEEVYRRFALWTLARKKDLRLLSLSSCEHRPDDSKVVSWVPDLSHSGRATAPSLLAVPDDSLLPDTRYQGLLHHCHPHQCYADGVLRPLCLTTHFTDKWFGRAGTRLIGQTVSLANDNSLLQLRGAVIDEVARTGDVSPFGVNEPDHCLVSMIGSEPQRWPQKLAENLCTALDTELHKVTTWLEQCMQLAASVDGKQLDGHKTSLSEAKIESFWLTLTCNRLINGYWARGHRDGLLRSKGKPTSQHDIIAELTLRFRGRLPPIDLQQPCFTPAGHRAGMQLTFREQLYKHLTGGQMIVAEREHILEQILPAEARTFVRFILPAMARWFRGRRFCVTSGNRYAAVPAGTQPGDVICVFLGATVPYVLRPQTDGSLSLVGECYVHGVMNGGAIYGEDRDQPFQFAERVQWQPRTTLSIR